MKPSDLESVEVYKVFVRCNCYILLGSGHCLCTGFAPLNQFAWIKASLKVIVSPTDCSSDGGSSY